MDYLEEATITDVRGIKASGIAAGLKKSGKKDLCIIYSEGEPVASAVFTQNKVKAAPILLNMEHIGNERTRAVVVNSGNANSCTGKQGEEDAHTMAEIVADELGIEKGEVLVQSTGIIGVPLDMDVVEKGIRAACREISPEGGQDAAVAIKTTDTTEKQVGVSIEIDGRKVNIAGMAKGSGMIHPNMATMLSFIMTDINISKELLSEAFKDGADSTFNMISVDGDTSTNDMAMVLANGLAGNRVISQRNQEYHTFKEALTYVNRELAKMIASDGEGATKLIEVEVNNARSLEDARVCAKSVVTSSLVKCAFFGEEANWGRIFCALGYSDSEILTERVDISFVHSFGDVAVARDGMGIAFDEERAKEVLEEERVKVRIDLKDGNYSATAWGCDLSYDYVRINGAYRT